MGHKKENPISQDGASVHASTSKALIDLWRISLTNDFALHKEAIKNLAPVPGGLPFLDALMDNKLNPQHVNPHMLVAFATITKLPSNIKFKINYG